MTLHIHETEQGVVLGVEYSISSRGEVEFQSVHVLDHGYRVTGPDICTFLHTLVRISEDPDPVGERYLSILAEEILSEQT